VERLDQEITVKSRNRPISLISKVCCSLSSSSVIIIIIIIIIIIDVILLGKDIVIYQSNAINVQETRETDLIQSLSIWLC
jgi:hypothetical protein